MSTLFLHALLGAIGIACMSGPLGCFIIWRKMAYFGDTIAHAALLGVVLALLAQVDTTIGVVLTGLLVAISLTWVQRSSVLPVDTLLGMVAHTALALALVLTALLDVRVDLNAYLFGDVLLVSTQDIAVIYIAAIIIGALIFKYWRALMMVVVHEDIAKVEQVPTKRMRFLLYLLVAFTVAVSVKMVGVLLVTSLLIIPAATARRFALNPLHMMVLALFAGVFSVALGLSAAFLADTPSGPSIILASMAVFMLSRVVKRVA